MDNDLWTYPETVGRLDLTGFAVEAADGSIGKVDESTNEAGASYLVVDTGVWIFGKKLMIPAGLVERVDRDEEKLYVAPTKEEIKEAPEFDDDSFEDHRSTVSDYYRGRLSAAAGNVETRSPSSEEGKHRKPS
ncbi:PRC-barrel domain-containing protein [Mycobacterium sp.]|uniref:PRC-barrel domain-containing protein n=1 Tax=Mycobacterium sp. TaxID=1785 RepID=UPI002C49B4E3|nr:PRC-barrel domain-containing protein [Mycobacterium sp.]HME47101.1 PRC-barrel domain-containing protein [Mycobacterium sp.]